LAQGTGEGLEGGLDYVVRVGAVELADVGVDARVRTDALEELRRELGVERADHLLRNRRRIHEADAAALAKRNPKPQILKPTTPVRFGASVPPWFKSRNTANPQKPSADFLLPME
jgi:hypothetical protein